MQAFHLGRAFLQIGQIVLRFFNFLQQHPSLDASLDRAAFIVVKINPCLPSQNGENLFEFPVLREVGRRSLTHGPASDVGLTADAQQFLGDFWRVQDEIHTAGGDGAARHAVVFGGPRILDQVHSAMAVNRLQAQGAVRTGPR